MWTLNFGSEHILVPAVVGWAVVIVACVLSLLFAIGLNKAFLREDANKYYACSSCGHRFKPEEKKLKRSLLTNGERILKCPKCGKVDYCAPSYDQEDR